MERCVLIKGAHMRQQTALCPQSAVSALLRISLLSFSSLSLQDVEGRKLNLLTSKAPVPLLLVFALMIPVNSKCMSSESRAFTRFLTSSVFPGESKFLR